MSAAACHVSPFSGTWYPEDPVELRDLLDSRFEESARRTGPSLLPGAAAFVVPHAGIQYSGTVAAAACRHLAQLMPRRVVLLGFPHRGSPAGLSIPDISAFRTPLGEIPVDRYAVQDLLDTGKFRAVMEAKLCDHSVEIQLPLLQYAVPEVQVLPIYVSQLDEQDRAAAAMALGALADGSTVFLASSDFTHYGHAFRYRPFPADEHAGSRIRELDMDIAEAAGSLREDLFFASLRETSSTVCGYEPIGLLLAILRQLELAEGEIFQQVLDYQTSGELTGSYEHSVSYAALGYFPQQSFYVEPRDQELLLDAARRSLAGSLASARRKLVAPSAETPSLLRKGAAFVTIYTHDELRGCIGMCEPRAPLGTAIPELTLLAAFEDQRFPAIALDELDSVTIEVSLLTPFKRIGDRKYWKSGEHGAMLQSGRARGLLLPKVAWERNWGPEPFFRALAQKAGVSPEVYHRPGTKLSVFRAQCFR